MVLTPSTMLPLQHPLPQFSLPLVSGDAPWSSLDDVVSSGDLPGRPLLVMLLCAHCPFVKHVEPEISRLEADFGDQMTLLAISSNSLTPIRKTVVMGCVNRPISRVGASPISSMSSKRWPKTCGAPAPLSSMPSHPMPVARKPCAIEANWMRVDQGIINLSTELIYGLPLKTSWLEPL